MAEDERIRPPSPGTCNRVTPEHSLDDLHIAERPADSLFGGPAEQLAPESDEGNIEYKLKLVKVDDDRFDRLVTQLRYRLTEGLGEALYELGVGDDGKPHGLDAADETESLSTLRRMAAAAGAEVTVLHCREGRTGNVIEAMVRERPLDGGVGLIELRVAVVGNVDSGKSTLVGVLTRGQLDNGRGLARGHCFRHKHEVDNGRTSSVSQLTLGFGTNGSVTNYSSIRPHTQEEVLKESSKLVTFVDLCGHERYLKTTVFGLTGAVPDFGAVVLGANAGVQKMTREHLGLLLALRLPFFAVITKIDLAPPNVLKETIDGLCALLKGRNVRKMPYLVKDATGCLACARQLAEGARLVPVFQVSNVNGENLDLLRLFLNALPASRDWVEKRNDKVEFCIDDAFNVPGVGVVIAGTVLKGSVRIEHGQGPVLLLGPDTTGGFKTVQVKGIHTKAVAVDEVRAGQSASFAVKVVGGNSNDRVLKRAHVRKGMHLLDPKLKPRAARSFAAEVFVLHHPTTIKRGYQPVVHARTVRQVAAVQDMNVELLRSGTRARVRFRFQHYPEYLAVGTPIIFREGNTRGIGVVKRVLYDDLDVKPMKQKDPDAVAADEAAPVVTPLGA